VMYSRMEALLRWTRPLTRRLMKHTISVHVRWLSSNTRPQGSKGAPW
jgi:hypothetical protein